MVESRNRVGALTLTTIVFVCGGSEAHAQAQDLFSRSRNVSVQNRPRPDFEAAGIRAGTFLVYPKVEFAAEYNDNIYAAAAGEQGAAVFHLRPEVVVESTWSQHFLTAFARGSLNSTPDYSSEDTGEYSFGASGRVDVQRGANIAGGADFASLYEPRTDPNSPAAAVEPVAVETSNAYVSGSRAKGRLRLSGRTGFRNYDYEDGRTAAGGVIDQDNRDREVTSVSGRVDWAVSPDTAVFIQVAGNDRKYDQAATPLAPTRDSSGVEYLAGASFEVGSLARGEIAAGYIKQDYDAVSYKDVDGFSVRGSLEWFATELTTVTFAAGRSVEDAVNPGASAYLSSSASVSVDHELLRNVILSGDLSYSSDDYKGIDRTDDRLSAGVGATYLVNRNIGITARASTFSTESSGAARDDDYRVNRLSIALVTQF
ncbi:outer membrane beta-barrel protein [soil metagenome]